MGLLILLSRISVVCNEEVKIIKYTFNNFSGYKVIENENKTISMKKI